MKIPKEGDVVIITKTGHHNGVDYIKGELWKVLSLYSDSCLECEREGKVTKIMFRQGRTHPKECELHSPKPEIINNIYPIY